MKEKFDLGLISGDPEQISRVQGVCQEFGFTLKCIPSLEEFLEDKGEYRALLATSSGAGRKESAAELAQGARFVSQDSFLICAVGRTMGKDAAQFAKKSGANLILLEDEVGGTSKLEFILTQVLRSSFLPIKVSDLQPDQPISFDLYHLLPQRKKFLKFIFSGDVIDAQKIEKISGVGEVYLRREDAGLLREYANRIEDRSDAGLARRCRARYLALCAGY